MAVTDENACIESKRKNNARTAKTIKNTISPPDWEGPSVVEVATDSQPAMIAVEANKHIAGICRKM